MAAATVNSTFLRSRNHLPWALRSRFGLTLRSVHSSSRSSRQPLSSKVALLASLAAIGASSAVYVALRRSGDESTKVQCQEQSADNQLNHAERPAGDSKQYNSSKPNKHINTKYLKSAIKDAHTYVSQLKEETGAPGLVVAVSIDGSVVWNEGFGYADVENNVKCSAKTVMRIASISKTLTATALAKLYEDNKIDLDSPIQKYVPDFPQKTFKKEMVTITTRQLLSHLGGIRHYEKPETDKKGKDLPEKDGQKSNASKRDDQQQSITESTKNISNEGTRHKDDIEVKEGQTSETKTETESNNTTKNKDNAKKKEFELEEYYIKEPKTLAESIALFKDDPLVSKPGEEFMYTSHGYTLVSGVVQAAAKEEFVSHMQKFFRDLGMAHTEPEYHDKITYNRARHYVRKKRHGLVNAPYVNNSYKWAGGGFLSTAEDLVRFGNAVLYARQYDERNHGTPGILKPGTVEEMWKVVKATEGKCRRDKQGWYGWGWYVLPENTKYGHGHHQKQSIYHTGGAVGAVSVLLLQPDNRPIVTDSHPSPPRGIVVAVIMNQQEVSRSMVDAARDIAAIFDDCHDSTKRKRPDN